MIYDSRHMGVDVADSAFITVVLFDIDGTLLDVKGAGRQAFSQALETLYGWRDSLDYIKFSGATDLDVLRKIFHHNGKILTREDQLRFFDHLPKELVATLADTQPGLYPGVRKLVEELSQDSRVLLGLVTGNIQTCAALKLEWAGLDNFFSVGAYGDECADRSQIAALAMQRARKKIAARQSLTARYLIGDTPSDVAAAEAIGARSVAVATGKHTRADLVATGAEIVFDDLSDVPQVMYRLGLHAVA